MTAVTSEDRPQTRDGAESVLPHALEDISYTVTTALAITLAMPNREQIDATTVRLRDGLRLLMAEELGADDLDPVVLGMFRDGQRLLELNGRPTKDSPQFVAYEHMRELGRLTRRFVSLYYEVHPEAFDG